MAKTGTKTGKTTTPSFFPQSTQGAPAPKPKPDTQQQVISIAPAEGAQQGLSLQQQASALRVVDAETNGTAKEFVRGAKQLKRQIEDHWSGIKRNVDTLKRSLLDLERKDLAPVVAAIEFASTLVLNYEAAEQRRVDAENARRQREAEQRAADERAAQLAQQEQAALDAEAFSPQLSAREAVFVDAYLANGDVVAAVKRAGYKSPDHGQRLLASPKIVEAIAVRREAAAIREQAAATAAAPLEVNVERVERQVTKVTGVASTTTWSAEVYDLDKFYAAAGVAKDSIFRDALVANQVFLNKEAVRLQNKLESVYPGVRAVSKTGLRG